MMGDLGDGFCQLIHHSEDARKFPLLSCMFKDPFRVRVSVFGVQALRRDLLGDFCVISSSTDSFDRLPYDSSGTSQGKVRGHFY